MDIVKFQEKVSLYISESLLSKPQYHHLLVELRIFESTKDSDVVYSSNAKITLRGSLNLEREIKTYIQQQLKEASGCLGLLVKISFGTKVNEDKKDQDAPKFTCENPKYNLSDVVMSKEKYEEIQNALSLIENYELVYSNWGWSEKEPAAKTIMCFYGAPGTGKTMCAHGIAKHLGKKILIASYADIQSEYVGVGPKNLKAIFQQAESEDAVLFFDEADSFLRKRTSDTSSSASMHYNSMTNEMMKHLEDFNGLVIFATNLTENTDDAFRTRITCSVEFTEPDEATRAKIISYMIPSAVPLVREFGDEDYLSIAQSCEGFVGRDIRNAVKYVLTEGARTGQYPFSVDSFVSGFGHYKESKDKFGESIDGEKNDTDAMSQVDVFTENGRILSLLSYVAWNDGEENEEEAEVLKEKAKIFNRNKIIIRKISDLAPIEEICEGIKHEKMKVKAVFHVADVLAVSGEDESNISLLHEIVNLLGLDEKVEIFDNYYGVERQRVSVVKSISETKGE